MHLGAAVFTKKTRNEESSNRGSGQCNETVIFVADNDTPSHMYCKDAACSTESGQFMPQGEYHGNSHGRVKEKACPFSIGMHGRNCSRDD